MNKDQIVNRVDHDCVQSNLCYPSDYGYIWIAQLDEDWVKKQLRMRFGHNVTHISNKYAILL